MDEVHLEDDEVAFLLEFKEPIDKQLDDIDSALTNVEDNNNPSHLIAELCMFHFTLGRLFEARRTDGEVE